MADPVSNAEENPPSPVDPVEANEPMADPSSNVEASSPPPTSTEGKADEPMPEQVSFWPRLLHHIRTGGNGEGPLQAMCCVCFEELSVVGLPAPVREDGIIQQAYINPCGHMLCRVCLDKLRHGMSKSGKCPVCREELYCIECDRPPLMVTAPDETEEIELVRYVLKTITSGGYFRPQCSRCFPEAPDRDMNVWMLYPEGMDESSNEEEDLIERDSETSNVSEGGTVYLEIPSDSDDAEPRSDDIIVYNEIDGAIRVVDGPMPMYNEDSDSDPGEDEEPSDEELIDAQASYVPPDSGLLSDSSDSEEDMSDPMDLRGFSNLNALPDLSELSDVSEVSELSDISLSDFSDLDELIERIEALESDSDSDPNEDEDEDEEFGDKEPLTDTDASCIPPDSDSSSDSSETEDEFDDPMDLIY